MTQNEPCRHVNTTLLSYGPPDFEPAWSEDGERVRFCLDCHKASDVDGLSQPAATPYPEQVDVPPEAWAAAIQQFGLRPPPDELAEAERRGAERGWDEGHAAHDLPPDEWRNPYRKSSSADRGAQEPVEVAGEGHDAQGGAE